MNQINEPLLSNNVIRFKIQDLFETSNQREYLKCGTKFYKKAILKLEIIEYIQKFSSSRAKLAAYCQIYFKVA